MEKRIQNNWWAAAAGAGALLGLRALRRKQKAYSFQNKVVLVTGGSPGLGLVLARTFAAEGARLALCARNAEELALAKKDLENRGAEVWTHVCDLRQEAEAFGLVRAAEAHYGCIDVLVNNAGVIQVGPLENMSLAEFREAMEVHYWAPLYTMLAVLPGMKSRREGRIVNIASVGGKVSLPHQIPYSGSKFALVGLSEGFRSELKPFNIPVTTINPGLTRTGSPGHAVIKGQHEKEYAWFTATDVFPLISMSAKRAAKNIVDACRYGEAERTLTMAGKLAALVHGISPGLVTDYFGFINRFLPAPGSDERASGRDSQSDRTPAWAEALNQQAARENNEQVF